MVKYDYLVTPNKLIWINNANNTSIIQLEYLGFLKNQFDNINVLEVGSAYGGAVETMAKVLRGRGKAYGYDTFEGHPSDLAEDPTSKEAICMEVWYNHEGFGRDRLRYDYQRKILDEQGLDNAILVKGRVNEHSFDDIKEAHMVMLDMDLAKPTKIAYYAIRGKIPSGGYLFLHDALPAEHLPLLHNFVYDEILKDNIWIIEDEKPEQLLLILKRR